MFDDYPISVVKMRQEHNEMFRNGWINGNMVYIGRGSPLHNPYSHKDSAYDGITKVESRDEACERFEFDLYNRRLSDWAYQALNKLQKMHKKGCITLVCFCKPEKCHGDVIRRYLENS